MRSAILSVSFVTCMGFLACGGTQTAPEAPAEEKPAPGAAAEPGAEPGENAPSRPELTAQECESSGGTVVGDIGDGAIHRPDYRCPSGASPNGTIRAPEGGPIAVEGSVCCPK